MTCITGASVAKSMERETIYCYEIVTKQSSSIMFVVLMFSTVGHFRLMSILHAEQDKLYPSPLTKLQSAETQHLGMIQTWI